MKKNNDNHIKVNEFNNIFYVKQLPVLVFINNTFVIFRDSKNFLISDGTEN